MRKKIAIVGGGLSGLSVGHCLKNTDFDFTIFEKSETCGGVIESHLVDGFLVEQAAPAFRAGPEGLFDLAQELGMGVISPDEDFHDRLILTDKGKLLPLPTSPKAFLKSKLLTFREKWRALRESKVSSTTSPQESVYDFFARRFGEGVAKKLTTPMVAGIYGCLPQEVTAAAAFPSLIELEQKGGIISSMKAAPKTPDNRKGLCSLEGGLSSLIEKLEKELGPHIQTNSVVEQVKANGSVVINNETHDFDHVIVTAPLHASAAILQDVSASLKERLVSSASSPVSVVALGVKLSELVCPKAFGFLCQSRRTDHFLGAVFEHAWAGRSPTGYGLVRCMVGRADLSYNDIILQCEENLRALGIVKNDAEFVMKKAFIWPRAIPRMNHEHSQLLTDAQSELGDSVFLTGGNITGVGVNHCFQSAKATVAKLIAIASIVFCFAACSSNKSEDAMPPQLPTEPLERDASPQEAPPPPTTSTEVSVVWTTPPESLLKRDGYTPCGSQARPLLIQHTLGGISEAIVVASPGAPLSDGADQLVYGSCGFSRKALVTSPAPTSLVISNGSNQPIAVSQGERNWKLPSFGSNAKMEFASPGAFSVEVGDEKVLLYVPSLNQSAQVTGPKGNVTLSAAESSTFSVYHHAKTVRGATEKTIDLKD